MTKDTADYSVRDCACGCGKSVCITARQLGFAGGIEHFFIVGHEVKHEGPMVTGSEWAEPAVEAPADHHD